MCHKSPDPPEERLMKIRELAMAVGLTTRTIRYFEEIGLLEPSARSNGAHRLYTAADLARLEKIRALRDDAGYTLSEIRDMVEADAVVKKNAQVFREAADAQDKVAALYASRELYDRQIASLTEKSQRVAVMLAEAIQARQHTENHIADVLAGREPHEL